MTLPSTFLMMRMMRKKTIGLIQMNMHKRHCPQVSQESDDDVHARERQTGTSGSSAEKKTGKRKQDKKLNILRFDNDFEPGNTAWGGELSLGQVKQSQLQLVMEYFFPTNCLRLLQKKHLQHGDIRCFHEYECF